MIKAECDRCGKQETVIGGERMKIMLPAPFGAYAPRLPANWKRVGIPADEEGIQGERKELCAECVNALRAFFEGDGAVPGLLEPENLPRVLEHDTPECPYCPRPGYQLTREHLQECHPKQRVERECNCPQPQAARPPCPVHEVPQAPCADGKHNMPAGSDACIRCGRTWAEFVAESGEDSRPNLTERARKIVSGEMRVSEAAELIPVGQTWMVCPAPPAGVGYGCEGRYERGKLREHMEDEHGVKVAEGSDQCLFCKHIGPVASLGSHVAAEHPGDWERWRSGGGSGVQ